MKRKTHLLRTAFALTIVLLIFSTFWAAQIQNSVSAETADIYRRHLRQDELLYELRRTVWLGGSAARDYLLNPDLNQDQDFRAHIRELEAESQRLLAGLDVIPLAAHPSPELRARLAEFWEAIHKTPSAAGRDPAGRYQFVQQEVVPRRNAAGQILRDFMGMNTRALQDDEVELALSRQSAARRLLMVLGLCMVMAVCVAVYSVHHTESLERRSAEQYAAMAEAKTELQQLSARLMEIQEEERTRLSRELHDEIGQSLAILKMDIARAAEAEGAQRADIGQRLARARLVAESTVKTIRNISSMLRPSLLDDLGLVAALQWQVEEFTRRTAVPCAFEEDGVAENLPGPLKTCVYRVVQESLHNCEKHAKAARVRVAVRQTDTAIQVAVEDDGVGFAAPATLGSGRFGILGMRERAAALGGVLEVSSTPGRGALVRLSVPVAPLREQAAGAA